MATSLDEPGPDVSIHVSCLGCSHWEHADYFGHCEHERRLGKGQVHGGATPWWCPMLKGPMARARDELEKQLIGNSLDGYPEGDAK